MVIFSGAFNRLRSMPPQRTTFGSQFRAGQFRTQGTDSKTTERKQMSAEDMAKAREDFKKKLEMMTPEERQKFIEERMDVLQKTTESLSELLESLKPLDEKTDTIAGEAQKMQE